MLIMQIICKFKDDVIYLIFGLFIKNILLEISSTKNSSNKSFLKCHLSPSFNNNVMKNSK